MKIQKVELKYFKFHQNLTIDFGCKNLLVYGENGTGKSSIYEGLYSNFYYIQESVRNRYLSRNCQSEELVVNITFDNSQVLNRKDDTLISKNILINQTVYFANEKVLNRLVKENFYIALKDTLVEHFPKLKELEKQLQNKFEEVRRWKDGIKHQQRQPLKDGKMPIDYHTAIEKYREQLKDELHQINELFKVSFNSEIPTDAINRIIKESFDENFAISFDVKGAEIPSSLENIGLDFEISLPIIKIKIDNIECNGKLSHHFNEAKLKLIGVAIYFALAKKYEASGTGFKLLVLDDFLTSLDMANRKLIMKYILEEFKDYQKLILTHNLQFFNVTKKLINKQYNNDEWKMQFLFLTQEEKGFIAYLKDKSNDYLFEAEEYLKKGEYQISGNFLRKEFESLSEELRQILELGDTESLNQIVELIKKYDSKEYYYFEPLTVIDFVREKITHLKDELSGVTHEKAQVNICNKQINAISQNFINYNKKDEIEALVSIIKKIEFYKDINFNATSHKEKEEVYRIECNRGISLLKDLRKIYSKIKKEKVK